MLFSLVAGGGGMAQFSHSEFGGLGQWVAGGPIMISDMFNNALKARGGRFVQRTVSVNSERTGLCRLPTLFNRKARARPGICDVDPQATWSLMGLTKRIGGLRILASLPASEHRTTSATPIFPTPSASPSTSTGR